MPPRVWILESVLRRLEGYGSGSGVEMGGFLMGRVWEERDFLVTVLSTVRTGRRNVNLGLPPLGAVGWFRSRSHGTPGLWSDGRAHAHLFPQTAGLFAVLAGGKAAFFHGKGRLLEPVLAVEIVDLPMEQIRWVESVEALRAAVQQGSRP